MHAVNGKDFVLYDTATKQLRVCDNTPGNGTAMGFLTVIGGNTVTLHDNNGNQDPCANTPPLGVNTNGSAYLTACSSTGNGCRDEPYFHL